MWVKLQEQLPAMAITNDVIPAKAGIHFLERRTSDWDRQSSLVVLAQNPWRLAIASQNGFPP